MSHKIERSLVFISGALLIAIILLMNVEIFARYFFRSSTRISEEFSGYMFCAATILGFYPALMRGRFLRITALLSGIPPKARAVAEVLVGLVSAAFSMVLMYQTWGLFDLSRDFDTRSEYYSETLLMYPQAILPAGFVLLSVGFLVRGLVLARALWWGNTALAEEEANVID